MPFPVRGRPGVGPPCAKPLRQLSYPSRGGATSHGTPPAVRPNRRPHPDLDLEDTLAPSNRVLYQRNMRQLDLPAFEHYALREISVRKVDQFIKTLAKIRSYSVAKRHVPC